MKSLLINVVLFLRIDLVFAYKSFYLLQWWGIFYVTADFRIPKKGVKHSECISNIFAFLCCPVFSIHLVVFFLRPFIRSSVLKHYAAIEWLTDKVCYCLVIFHQMETVIVSKVHIQRNIRGRAEVGEVNSHTLLMYEYPL